MSTSTPVSESVKLEFDRCSKDFFYFCEEYLKILHPVKGLIPFKLYDFQKSYVRHLMSNRFTIAKKFRQGGFSTLTIAYLFWKFIFHENQNILLLSSTDREALSLMSIVYTFLNELPEEFLRFVKTDKQNDHTLCRGKNNICSYGTSRLGIGKEFSIVFLDEPAFWTNAKNEWASLFPSITSNKDSKVIVVSTTNGTKGRGNWFWETYDDAINKRNNFSVFSCNYKQHPLYQDEKFVSLTRQSLGPIGFSQEVECEFLDECETLKEVTGYEDGNFQCYDVTRPIKLSYDEEFNFSTPEKRAKLLYEKDDGTFSDPEEEVVFSYLDKKAPETKKEKEKPHNKDNVFPHNQQIWNVDPKWKDDTNYCEGKEDQPVLRTKKGVVSPAYGNALSNLEVLKLCGLVSCDAEDLVEDEESAYSSVVLEIIMDEDLPNSLQVRLGNKYVEVQGVPTKIESEGVKKAYDGLSVLVGEKVARQHVAKILRKKIKKLF